MTASVANGFGHALFQPNFQHLQCCTLRLPSHVLDVNASRPASTGPLTPTTWPIPTSLATLSIVARLTRQSAQLHQSRCYRSRSGLDADDTFCFASGPQLITGCLEDDEDFDGPSYNP